MARFDLSADVAAAETKKSRPTVMTGRRTGPLTVNR